MHRPRIEDAIVSLCPEAHWYWSDNIYENIVWMNPEIKKPTLEEIEAEMQRLQAEWEATEYQRLRAPEYPSLTNLADAMYWNSKGDSSHLEAYFAACEEVKNKYPKP